MVAGRVAGRMLTFSTETFSFLNDQYVKIYPFYPVSNTTYSEPNLTNPFSKSQLESCLNASFWVCIIDISEKLVQIDSFFEMDIIEKLIIWAN